MTKVKIIGIIAGIILIIGLAFVMYELSNIAILPQDPEDTRSLEIKYIRENVVIFKSNLKDVENIHVVNKYGDYSVSQTEQGAVQILGREGAPLFPYSSAGLFESVEKITCDALIEEGSKNLEYYGLDKPQATVLINLKNGTQASFSVGDAAPAGGGYYFRDVVSNDIYLVNSFFAERYLSDYIALYQTTISKQFDITGFQSLRIKPATGEEIFIRTTTEAESKDIRFVSGMIMEAPFFFGAESSVVSKIMETLSTLEASKIVTDTLDVELQKQYGFDNPTLVEVKALVDTATQVLNEQMNPYYDPDAKGVPLEITSTYLIGGFKDRDLYIMYDGAPVIYSVDIDTFAFASKPIDQYCQRIVNIKYLNELDEVTVETGGVTNKFTIENPDAGDEMVIIHDYVQLDASIFRSFYKSIIGVTHYGLADKPLNTEPMLKITYGAIDGNDIVLEFIPIDDRNVFIQVNGEGRFYALRTRVDKIINDMQKLLNGEEIMS